jgi:hypothetical protein
MTADSTIHVGLQEMNTIFLFSAHNWKQKKKQYAPIQTKVMMNQLQWLDLHTCIASYAMANLASYTAVQKKTMNQHQRLF